MIKLSKNVVVSVFVGMSFLLTLMALPAVAQDLEKKYAPILGDYEFDMTESGQGVMTVQFYVENDALWAWPQDAGDPGEMIPKEGEEFVFTIEDEMSVWVLTFSKDENGKYTKCHAVNEAQGIDITGEKIIE
ncbi:MAG: hypothetical protein JSV17_15780 [Candidatus Aminicenantes bacterium]|nr:MAG: hypothetical protein JSV17_15780 [Candidatus Aminicenantes bacterium]